MLYGSVPYDSKSIQDLLQKIQDKGPNYSKKRVSSKVEQLLRGLLEPNPQLRMTHAALFDTVLKDPQFPISMIESQTQVDPSSLGRARKSLDGPEEIISHFTRDILWQRSKYKYYIEIAMKATQFKKYVYVNIVWAIWRAS